MGFWSEQQHEVLATHVEKQRAFWMAASCCAVQLWLCWNADVVAKLTVVSPPDFSVPSFPWFSGNGIQNLLLPAWRVAQGSLTAAADLLLHLPLLCPLSGGDRDVMPGSSRYSSFSECFVCLSVLCALQGSAVPAVLTADSVLEILPLRQSDISVWKLKPCSPFFCMYFFGLLYVSWAPLEWLRSSQERDNP